MKLGLVLGWGTPRWLTLIVFWTANNMLHCIVLAECGSLALQLPDEAKELDKELRQITKQKNEAVRGQDFEKVCYCCTAINWSNHTHLFRGPWTISTISNIFSCYLIIIFVWIDSTLSCEIKKIGFKCSTGSDAIGVLHGSSANCTISRILSILCYRLIVFVTL
jgi:hypothetical protein